MTLMSEMNLQTLTDRAAIEACVSFWISVKQLCKQNSTLRLTWISSHAIYSFIPKLFLILFPVKFFISRRLSDSVLNTVTSSSVASFGHFSDEANSSETWKIPTHFYLLLPIMTLNSSFFIFCFENRCCCFAFAHTKCQLFVFKRYWPWMLSQPLFIQLWKDTEGWQDSWRLYLSGKGI